MDAASAIMAEHNLAMASVEAVDETDKRIEDVHVAKQSRRAWARTVWGAVAELNFCWHLYRAEQRRDQWVRINGKLERQPPRQADEHILIGVQANVEATKAMADYLVEAVERLSRQEPGLFGQRDRYAYMIGCSERLARRLRKLKADRERAGVKAEVRAEASAPTVTVNLPALANLYVTHDVANRELFEKAHGYKPHNTSARPGTSRADAYSKGYAAGGKVSLNAQVGRASVRSLPKR